MERTIRWLACAASATALAVLLACSFSYSSGKLSDSSKSSSESSASSSPGSSSLAYRSDVSDYTAAYVKSSDDFASFRSGLGEVARKRGINDWENDPSTWQGIGEGLARAKVSRAALDVYVQNLSGGIAARAAAIQKGYDAAS